MLIPRLVITLHLHEFIDLHRCSERFHLLQVVVARDDAVFAIEIIAPRIKIRLRFLVLPPNRGAGDNGKNCNEKNPLHGALLSSDVTTYPNAMTEYVTVVEGR